MSKTPYNDLPKHLARPPAEMIAKLKKRRAKADSQAEATPSAYRASHYTGSELAPYTGRPGSLDHLLLPSRTGKTLHYRSLASIKSIRSEPMPA